ncbi:MAG: ATP-binding protein [Candidatus Aenigmarchaeota archaeon]|nr:ATP-binding protein [Candidatus Aenigmarchaeota archaeon]
MTRKIYKRRIEDRIKKFIKRREIICIRGARQVGKTTLLKMLEKMVKSDKAFINLDLVTHRRNLEENPIDFVERFKKPKRRLTLFLDEIQRVKDAGEKLKIIYDEFSDVKMFISGSSSLEIKTNVFPQLVGRLFVFDLFTFDFLEYISTKDDGLARILSKKQKSLKNFIEGNRNIKNVERPSFTDQFTKYLKEYLIFGGYPEVVKSNKYEEKEFILKNIYNLYLEKDIISFFRIEDTSKFEDVLRMLAFNTSNVISLSSISSDIGINYKKSEEFLTILEHSYIIYKIRPFHKNMTTEIKKSPKIYFLDIGLRNSIIDNFSKFESRTDGGALLENFVLRELITNFHGWKINYWRTTGGAEIDFILTKKDEVIPIEVKMSGNTLGKGFYSFLKRYKPKKGIIVTLDKFKKEKIEDTMIYWVPAYYI